MKKWAPGYIKNTSHFLQSNLIRLIGLIKFPDTGQKALLTSLMNNSACQHKDARKHVIWIRALVQLVRHCAWVLSGERILIL